MRDIHTDWAWVVIVSNGLVGLWSTGAYWLAPLRLRSMWWLVVAAEVAIFVQVGMGVWLLSVQNIPAPDFHTFYGFVTLISVMIPFAYRNQLRAHLYLLYGLGSLFLRHVQRTRLLLHLVDIAPPEDIVVAIDEGPVELRFDPMDPYTPPKVFQDGCFEADAVWLDRHANSTGARKPVPKASPEQLVPPGIDPLDLLVRAYEARLGLADPGDDAEEDEP